MGSSQRSAVRPWQVLAALGAILALPSCAPQPPPPAPPAVAVAPTPTPAQVAGPKEDWNIFPDPITGRVEVYKDGAYVGSVTGDEPATEDPPLPRVRELPTDQPD